MPLSTNDSGPTKFPEPAYQTLSNWKRGVITLIDKSRLPQNALEKADNLFLYEDGNPGPRPGVDWFGEAPGRTATSFSPSASHSPSASLSPSASKSPSSSASVSLSPSASKSPSASLSPSASKSPSSSASGSQSPSASISPSASQSNSPSASHSPSSSTSATPSASLSPSASFSPSASHSPSSSNSPSLSASASEGTWSQIDGFDYFDFNGAVHIVAAAGGAIFRSTDDAVTWTYCSGYRYTAGTDVNMNQYNSFLYITDGLDVMARYDGTTTLATYTTLATPTAPTAANTGLATTNFQYLYRVAAVNTVGTSLASADATGDTKFTTTRDNWSDTAYVTITAPATTGATRYDLYISEDGVTYYYLDSVVPPTVGAAAVYRDTGVAVVNPVVTIPAYNSTTGPLVEELSNVGSRMVGLRDTSDRYKIWYSSGTPPYGAFSNSYDGGYVRFQTGGKLIPTHCEDYRDGKGTPLATIWCDSADGQGGILQMSFDQLTIGDISITVPSVYKLPGSRGTPAPLSVVNVLNDYFFYNSQAFYNLGSRAQFLNLLSTDEMSANIRPDVRSITEGGQGNICGVYFDARVYFSVPYNSGTNNYTAVYDTERKAWLPKAFTLGFKKFLRYTDTGGTRRLLALKPGDSKLSEISSDIQGDYGVAFSTLLSTGLYPVNKDRFAFQWTEEGEFEVAGEQGVITVDLLGVDRAQGYRTIKSKTLSVDAATASADTWEDSWDRAWDQFTAVTTTTSESSVKRYFNVQRELNAVQWNISTNGLTSKYILRTLQTWGTNTQSGHPRSWRL